MIPSVFFTKETSDERQLINIGSLRPKLQRWTLNDLTIKERFKNCFVSGTDAFQWDFHNALVFLWSTTVKSPQFDAHLKNGGPFLKKYKQVSA